MRAFAVEQIAVAVLADELSHAPRLSAIFQHPPFAKVNRRRRFTGDKGFRGTFSICVHLGCREFADIMAAPSATLTRDETCDRAAPPPIFPLFFHLMGPLYIFYHSLIYYTSFPRKYGHLYENLLAVAVRKQGHVHVSTTVFFVMVK